MNRHLILTGSSFVAFFLVVAGGIPLHANNTGYNENPWWPTTCTCTSFTGFEFILPGDVTGVTFGNYNSFTNPTKSIAYNSMTNQTTLLFTSSTGATIPLGPGPGSFGPSGSPTPHFGISGNLPGTGGEKLAPVTQGWLYGTSSTVSAPALGATLKSGSSTGPVKYLVEYITASLGGGSTGSWFELPYQGSYSSSFIGSTGSSVTLSSAKYFTTTTQIPLDNLNIVDLPPSSPQFSPIPGIPDGTLLTSGGTIAGPSTPEPAPWTTMVLGIGLVAS